ncbi:hypothetical protein BN137_1475 [Cronobacter condimenti 1330]|uniref:Uncharacterized protein n=1 Tax=Cronobacter condimenti 1330 TaxID=1073999 RepID=K8A092_9ENTR|nr:hypothetical protein BN137_1475 [Cronobacter condimenti 1330]
MIIPGDNDGKTQRLIAFGARCFHVTTSVCDTLMHKEACDDLQSLF